MGSGCPAFQGADARKSVFLRSAYFLSLRSASIFLFANLLRHPRRTPRNPREHVLKAVLTRRVPAGSIAPDVCRCVIGMIRPCVYRGKIFEVSGIAR